jgi:hypothetical protein
MASRLVARFHTDQPAFSAADPAESPSGFERAYIQGSAPPRAVEPFPHPCFFCVENRD